MIRTALVLSLLLSAPAAAIEIPVPPERPVTADTLTDTVVAAPPEAERPDVDAPTNLAPFATREPAPRKPSGAATEADPDPAPQPTPSPAEVAAPAAPGEETTAPTPTAGPVGTDATPPAGRPVEKEAAPGTGDAVSHTGGAPRAATTVAPIAARKPTPRVRAAPAPAAIPRDTGENPADAAEDPSNDPFGTPVPPEKPVAKALRTAMLDTRPPPPSGGSSGRTTICGDPRLQGRIKPTVVGHHPGCLIQTPVEVTRIAGVRLSTPATLSCRTARTFANWIAGVADPAARQILGARIKRVWVMGSFACRTRNSQRGARLSEHSVGRAVDVGGFTLGDGRKIRVKSDWGRGKKGRFLRHVWKTGCGMFKTVLGPDGDRFHQDHLHFDTALRKRSFCR